MMRIIAGTCALCALLAVQGCAGPEASTCPTPDLRPLAGTPTALQDRFATAAFWDHLVAHGSNRQLAAMIRYAGEPGFDTAPANIARAKAALSWRAAQGCPDVPDSPRV